MGSLDERPQLALGPWAGARATVRTQSPRIVAVLPRGEAIRNFVYTCALDEVAQRADLTILSVIPSDNLRELLEARYPAVLPLHAVEDRWITGFLREILDMAHGRWLWSAAARQRWHLRDLDCTTPRARIKRMVKKAASWPFASRAGLRLLSRLERQASRWFRASDEYVELFRQLRPTLLFSGSQVHGQAAIAPVEAAQWLGIPTVAFVFSWDNLTSQGRVIPPYDYYLVWNAGLRDQLLRIYDTVSPACVFITGTPQFDAHFRTETYWPREEFCARVGADPGRPIVLYTTGMANHVPGEPRIVAGIADLLQTMEDLGAPQLLVRVYPKDRSSRFEELKRSRPDILFPEVPWEEAWLTPKPEDSALLTNTLRHAALGINVASTISLELCMFDKPVINVCYNPPGMNIAPLDYRRFYDFDHYRPVIASGAVTLAYSEAHMGSLIRRALTQPTDRSASRRRLLAAMFGSTLDGRSGKRVADAIYTLATSSSH